MFVIIGTTTADLFIFCRESFASLGGDGFRARNLLFTDDPLSVLMGGNGGNSAHVLAGLGVPTALCSSVGRDPLGDILVNWLRARNVVLDGLVRRSTHATSTSTIIMSDAANQVVFHHLGSTTQHCFEDMPATFFTNAQVLLASSFSIMPKMRAGGYARALARVHKAGGITALDVGPAIGQPVTLPELIPLLPTVDHLIANTHELVSLTGATDWPSAAGQVLAAGARQVVIKQGEHGASVWTPTDQVNVPGFKVETNISVGAGDSFNAGFLYGVQQQWPLEQALRFGNAVAALVVTSPRGVLNSPTLVQVETFLNANR